MYLAVKYIVDIDVLGTKEWKWKRIKNEKKLIQSNHTEPKARVSM